MVHLKTLLGYPQHQSMSVVLEQAIEDALLLEQGGVDAILIENTDDDPHQKIVSPEIIAAFTVITREIKAKVKVVVLLSLHI